MKTSLDHLPRLAAFLLIAVAALGLAIQSGGHRELHLRVGEDSNLGDPSDGEARIVPQESDCPACYLASISRAAGPGSTPSVAQVFPLPGTLEMVSAAPAARPGDCPPARGPPQLF